MLWPKKIHTRNLITKKNSCRWKFVPPSPPLLPPPSPHNFSNGPSLICFIIAQFIIDCVYHDNENPQGNTFFYSPYRYWSEMRSRVRIWTTRQHTPLRIPWNMPRIAQSIIDSVHFLNQKSGWVHPCICLIGTGLK